MLLAQNSAVYTSIPKSDIKIIVPNGFESTDYYQGFINKKATASIVLKEVGGIAHWRFRQSLKEPYFAQQKLVLKSEEVINTQNIKDGRLYIIGFIVDGVPHERLMLVTGTDAKTVMLLTNYPTRFKGDLYLNCRKALLSIKGF